MFIDNVGEKELLILLVCSPVLLAEIDTAVSDATKTIDIVDMISRELH